MNPPAGTCRDAERLPPGFHTIIATQAVSALADNALLIVAIALLQQQGLPGWWAPLLKLGFTLAYVVLAPLLGPIADAVPKCRLMLVMAAVKLLGTLALLAGLNPVVALSIVGFGAALYAPAKYGLVTEIVRPHKLVAANGWIEVSVVGAVLLGTGLGGLLASPAWLVAASRLLERLDIALPSATGPLTGSVLAIVGLHTLSAVMNLRVPDSGVRYARCARHPRALWRDFLQANRTLWRDREGGLSLAATTVFWGAGATLQFVVLRWGQEALGLPLHQAALLQAVVAVGVVAGACAAGRWVTLAQAPRMLVCGIGLGLMLPLLALTPTTWLAVPLLLLAGAIGGLMVVPLNALLQHRGHQLLSAGRSIAIQGFNENAGILLMLGLYSALVGSGLPIEPIMWALGLGVAGAIAALRSAYRRRPAATIRPAT